ncbi:MAG TPA: hypothetical protein PKY30_23055, partial [Myxococcota bacterium]|nr:hypothetical protein [Myxococcota bacterium]
MDPESERLVLPSLILNGRHLRIVDYWHHQISSTPLPRIGVDWHRRLHPASSALLDRLQLIHGRDGMVVAVQICRENTDIDEVLRAFDRFRFVVIYTDLPCRNVHLGGLNSLCWRLRKVLAKLFPRRCEELNLPNRWEVLDPLLRDLADPEEIVALANGFLEVQLGGLREEGWVNALKRQVIVRQMLTRKPDEFVQLLAYACRRPKEDRLRLCGESDPEHQVRREEALAQELAEKDLLLDTNLRGW